MTNEQKRLLEIDLCSRLPYGVKLLLDDDIYDLSAMTITQIGFTKGKKLRSVRFTDDKLPSQILFPLSSLTREIQISTYNDGKPFVPIVELAKLAETQYFDTKNLRIDTEKNIHGCSWLNNEVAFAFVYLGDEGSFFLKNENEDEIFINNMYKLFDFLNQWHIDYRGLIDQNLAISVETLESNPYA